jgi:uncharacterized protein YdeI (YjbR/CyaY-like superfamily)
MSKGETGRVSAEVPTDLQVALSADPSAMEAWNRLTSQDREAHIADLESAPEPLARTRCLENLVHDLSVETPGHGRR